jgi:RHS repeat-associated protein
MTFAGEEPLLETMKLTAEVDSLEKEKGNFANIESVRTTENAENSEYSVRVSAYSPAITSKVLRVEKGGSLSLRAAAKYEENKSILLKNNKLNKIKATDLLPLVAVTPMNFGNSETKNYAIGVNLLGILPVAKKIVNVIKSPIITPKKLQNAVIEISFYKDSLLSEQIFSKQISVSENAAYDWEVLKDSLIFEESGFVRVTLRNSNSLPVLFDNLELRTYGTSKAKIIQENHYEPFGMTLQGLDYVADNTRKNSYLFNGKELQEELGLQLYDYHARQVDPQTGRMNSVDPHADSYHSWTSYNYCGNNPVNLIDADGKDWGDIARLYERAGQKFNEGLNKTSQAADKSIQAGAKGIESGTKAVAAAIAFESGDMELGWSLIAESASLAKDAYDLGNQADALFSEGEQAFNQADDLFKQADAEMSYTLGVPVDAIRVKYRKEQIGDDFGQHETKIENGVIMMKQGNNWVPANFFTDRGKQKHVDFVITMNGDLSVGDGHYYLSNSALWVQGAGRIKIENGKITNITNNTGHYRPNEQELNRQAKILDNMGITAPNRTVKPIQPVK